MGFVEFGACYFKAEGATSVSSSGRVTYLVLQNPPPLPPFVPPPPFSPPALPSPPHLPPVGDYDYDYD